MLKQPSKPITNYKDNRKTKILYGPVATIFASTKTGTWRLFRPMVDQASCSLCGNCQKYCPADIVVINKEAEHKKVSFDFDYCKGCGICANVCPKDSITMVIERKR